MNIEGDRYVFELATVEMTELQFNGNHQFTNKRCWYHENRRGLTQWAANPYGSIDGGPSIYYKTLPKLGDDN